MMKPTRIFQLMLAAFLLCLTGAAVTHGQSQQLLIGMNYEPVPRGSAAAIMTEAQIGQDLDMLAQKFTTIRIYQSQGIGETIVRLASEKKLEVVIETWLTGDAANDEAEIEAAIALANDYENVAAVIVGSEVLSRGDLTVDALSAAIGRVREAIPANIPIGYADVFLHWIQNPALAQLVDWVGLDSYGFLDCQMIQPAIQFSINQWALLVSNPAFASKNIVLMETGWPTQGSIIGCTSQELTSLQTQAQFVNSLMNNAAAAQLDTFMTEFADAPWRCEGADGTTYGCHWGLVGADRTPKPSWGALPDVIRPPEAIPVVGVVAADDRGAVNCRVEPNMEQTVQMMIDDGEAVTILDRSSVEGWVKVEYDDNECWVHHSLLLVDGRSIPAISPILDVNATSLRSFLASADPFLCSGTTPGELTASTWSALDIVTVASCVRNFDVWTADADAQQSSLQTSGVCETEPSAAEAESQERFQNIWALDNMAIAYYNLGRGLRTAGEYQLAQQAFEYITTNLSCAWAYDSTSQATPYFWSLAAEAQTQIETLPLATAETSP